MMITSPAFIGNRCKFSSKDIFRTAKQYSLVSISVVVSTFALLNNIHQNSGQNYNILP